MIPRLEANPCTSQLLHRNVKVLFCSMDVLDLCTEQTLCCQRCMQHRDFSYKLRFLGNRDAMDSTTDEPSFSFWLEDSPAHDTLKRSGGTVIYHSPHKVSHILHIVIW